MWAWVLGTATGVGALAGSGQLGIGYGLGFLRFDRQFPNDGVWSAQLTWVAWFAALAVIGGAAAGAWAARHRGLDLRLGGKVALVAAAGLGASVVTPLTLLPASSATVLMRERPVLATALTALLGVVVGFAAAATALSVRLVAVSLTLLVAVVWLLALVSALPALLPGADPPDARLAVLDLSVTGGGSGSTVAIVTIPVVSLLVCGGVAAAARSRGLPPLSTAVASTAAPGLLALCYVIGTPGTGDRAVQTSPYAASLIAVAVGLLTSLLIGVVRLPSRRSAGVDSGATDTINFQVGTLAGPSPAPPAAEPPASPAADTPDSSVVLTGPSTTPEREPSAGSPLGSPAWSTAGSSGPGAESGTESGTELPSISELLAKLERERAERSERSGPGSRPGASSLAESPAPASAAESPTSRSTPELPAWPPPTSGSRPGRPGDVDREPLAGSTSDRPLSDRPLSDRPLSDRPSSELSESGRSTGSADRPTAKPWERPFTLDRPTASRFDPPAGDPTGPPRFERPRMDRPLGSRFDLAGEAGDAGTATAPSAPTGPGSAEESPWARIPKARTPSDPPSVTTRFDPPSWAVADPAAASEASGAPAGPRGAATGSGPGEPARTDLFGSGTAPGEPAPAESGEPVEDPPEAPAKGLSRLLKPKKRSRKSGPPPAEPGLVASLPAPRTPDADADAEPGAGTHPEVDAATEPERADDRPTSPPPLAPPRPGREGEEEHLDWISSLAGDDGKDEFAETGRGRRRLRRDRDLSISVDDLPEPPSRPAHR